MKDFRLEFMKREPRTSRGVLENEEMDLVDRSATSQMKKELMHGVGAGNVGAPAAHDSFAPQKKGAGFGMVRTWTSRNLIREPLGMSWP
jgi:hypothetical protein